MRNPRGVKAAVAFVAGTALLAALVAYVGPSSIVATVRGASPWHLLFAFAAYGAFFLLRGLRWRLLLSAGAPGVRLSSTTGLTAVGWLANSFLPLKSGDVLRAALVARRERLALAHAATSIAFERVLDLLGLAFVAAVALFLLPDAVVVPGWMTTAVEVAWAIPLLGLLVLLALVRWRGAAGRAATRATRPLGRAGATVADFFRTSLEALAALLSRPGRAFVLAPLTLLVAVAQALVFTFLVMAFLHADARLAFSGGAIFLLSFVISLTPGNVGTYEAAFAAVFVALGVGLDEAVAAALLTHVATTLMVAVLGAVGLFALGVDPSKLPERSSRVVLEGAP